MERPHRNKIDFSAVRNPETIAALAAFCLVIFSAPSVGLSPDSISYTSVARNLYHGNSPHEFDGEWLVDFPLGYPVFLSFIMFVSRLDPFQFGLVLNGILFGILVFICLRELKRNGFPPYMRYGYGLCLLFSTALLQVYGMLWSETLFILCIAFFFAASGQYGRTHGIKALCTMAGATALACVTRYIGVTLLGMGLLLLLTDPILPGRKRLFHLLLYGIAGSSLLLANLVLNRFNDPNMAGDRLVNHVPFLEHLQRFGAALLRWLPLPSGAGSVYTALTTVCAIAFLGGSLGRAGYLLWRKRSLYSWPALGLLFTALYSVFILALATLTAFQPLDSRLLSPIWFPALGAAGGGTLNLIRQSSSSPRKNLTRWLTGGLIGLSVILLLVPGMIRQYHYLSHPDRVYQDNIRYDFSTYLRSPTLGFINDHPRLFHTDKEIYSNAGELLYVLDTLNSAYLPQLNSAEDMQDFNGDTAYLVWLRTVHAYPEEYLTRLKQASTLSPLYSFPDGIIFSILPTAAPPPTAGGLSPR